MRCWLAWGRSLAALLHLPWLSALESSFLLQPDMAMDLPPGSIFVHRNLGGLVNHKDLNAMSCLEYALVLGVKHVIVSGHYNCGTQQSRLD